MREKISKILSVVSGKRRSVAFRLWALLGGSVVFLLLVPFVLGVIGWLLSRLIPLSLPHRIEIMFGVPLACLGLAILAWAMFSFWRRGEGTPAPMAAPQKLVVAGPYRYCRNPIQLGANLYYLGLGSIVLSLTAGMAMFIIGLALGSAYHRFLEEPELALRFGAAYEEYRRQTPFLWPRFWRKRAAPRSNSKPV